MHKEFFLNPYNFSLMAMRRLVEFTDEYLRILKERTQFAGIIIKRDIRDLDTFSQGHLGF